MLEGTTLYSMLWKAKYEKPYVVAMLFEKLHATFMDVPKRCKQCLKANGDLYEEVTDSQCELS